MTKHDLPFALLALALAAIITSPTVAGLLSRAALAGMLQMAGVLDSNTALAVAEHWHW
jgi:multisubunit Na+/H+ antiporter MnhG subunit